MHVLYTFEYLKTLKVNQCECFICVQYLQFKIWDNDNFREDDKAGLVWVSVNDYVSHGQVMTVDLNKKG